MAFKTFWFESSQLWGLIECPEHWKNIVEFYKRDNWLRADMPTASRQLMKEAKASDETADIESGMQKPHKEYIPRFELYSQYYSQMTLEDWAKKNGMYDDMVNI